MTFKRLILIIVIVFAGLIAVFIIAEGMHNEIDAADEQRQIAGEKDRVKQFLSSVTYIRDGRTDACFAWRQAGTAEVLATVSCEKIPPKMLRSIF